VQTSNSGTQLLQRVSPNPATDRISISYQLPHAAQVSIAIIDQRGREVVRAFEGSGAAGEHGLEIDCSMLPSGVYFIRCEAGSQVDVHPVVIGR
jgi:hypothetical protein